MHLVVPILASIGLIKLGYDLIVAGAIKAKDIHGRLQTPAAPAKPATSNT